MGHACEPNILRKSTHEPLIVYWLERFNSSSNLITNQEPYPQHRLLSGSKKLSLSKDPSFFRDLVVPFSFPDNRSSAKVLIHEETLLQLENENCTFLPLSTNMDELKPLGLSFIHFSVINQFAEESFGPFKSLAESIIIYSLPREKDSSARSRDFGLCIANALHFYFSNQGASFQLRPICRAIRPSSKETIFDLALVPLPSIQHVDEDAIKIIPITIGSDVFEPRLEGAKPELISELAPGVYFSSVSKSDEFSRVTGLP